jgi:hypothetical protein
MTLIARVMRAMTHINIGSALALFAWVVCSGGQVASGAVTPDHTAPAASSRSSLPPADAASPMGSIPARSGQARPPCCQRRPGVQEAPASLSGTDLWRSR